MLDFVLVLYVQFDWGLLRKRLNLTRMTAGKGLVLSTNPTTVYSRMTLIIS